MQPSTARVLIASVAAFVTCAGLVNARAVSAQDAPPAEQREAHPPEESSASTDARLAPPPAPGPIAERARPENTSTQPTHVWRDGWGESGPANFAMIGVALGAVVANLVVGGSSGRVERGRNDFDEGVRNTFRLNDEVARQVARDVSDGLLAVLVSAPILLDAVLLGAWRHRDERAGVQMAFMQAEVIAMTLAMQTFANAVMGRERPYGRTCGAVTGDSLPANSFFCNAPDRYYSFFSGHSSQSFASAAAMCSMHINMNLISDGPENVIVPCVAGFSLATTAALMRLAGDMHYASDVLVGASVGTLVGFLLPWLLHFSHDDRPNAPHVMIVPTTSGVSVVGAF